MAVFVKVTGVDNIEQVVNLDQVTRVIHYAGANPYTTVHFDRENSVAVKETPRQILAQAGFHTAV